VTTVDEMRNVFIGITDKQLKDRLHLPSSKAMPKALRKAIIAL
jgi:hypothetical protein